MTTPNTMNAVVLHEYSGASGLRIENVPLPSPGPGEVLIRVGASPINPSDLAFIEGKYVPRPPLPTRPGLEGSGTVVEAGSGALGRYLRGKRVAFVAGAGSGAWGEYTVASNKMALPLNKGVSLHAGAMSVVNPMTALAFLQMSQAAKARAVVNTAAAGSLGRMIDRVLDDAGITVINVVRRHEQAESLRAEGVDIVLDTSSPDFDEELREACVRHEASLAFDAIGGALTRQLLACLIPKSEVVVYGGLAQVPSQAEVGDLIFADKKVTGFWLSRWVPEQSAVRNLRLWRKVQSLIGSSLRSEIRATSPLQEAAEAVTAYQSAMTSGKILLTPRVAS